MELENFKYQKVNTSNENQQEVKENEENENIPVSYLELFKFSTKLDKILLLVAVVLCTVSGVSEALFSVAFGKGIGTVVGFETELSNAVNETEKLKIEEIFLKKAKDFAIFTGCNGILIGVSFYVGSCLFNYTAMKQTFKIRELYFSRVLNQDIAWHDQSSTGDFASRITEDLRKIQEGMNDKAAFTIFYVGVIITDVIQSLIFGWELTLACLVPFPIFFLIMAFIGKLSTKFAKNEAEARGKAGTVADETLTFIKTVTAFNGQKEEAKRYDKFLLVAMKNNIKKYFYAGLSTATTSLYIYFCIIVCVWYGGHLVLKSDDYNIEKLVTIQNATLTAVFYVGAITPFFATFNAAKGAAYKIFSVIQSEPSINQSYQTGIEIKKIKGSIRFQDVNFSYPARNQVEVLKNFNLNIKSGETLALVGSSGCGKSTVIQLIQRFYDATTGNIFIDDKEIKSLNLTNLRNQIGTVDQEPVLFDGTVSENIRLGNLDATQNEVEEAAKKSYAHSFILSFPDGYQTVIGERGTQLSGGQKQRIAMARALVRNPTILLLDEATSMLDSNSKFLVQETLERVSKDCTTVIVAHRLSSVRKADRIVVLDKGTVVEEGSHDDLMASHGVYYNLVVTELPKHEEEGSPKIEFDTEPNYKKSESHQETKEDTKNVDLSFIAARQILMSYLHPKWCMVLGVLFSIVSACAIIISSLIFGKSLAVISGQNFLYALGKINKYSFCILVIGFIVAVSNVFQSYLIGKSGENLTMRLRSSMFKNIIYQEMGWFDQSKNGVGSLSARLADEPSSVQNAIGLCTGPFLNAITMTMLLLCIGFYLSWKLLLGYFGFLPFLILLLYMDQKVLVEEHQKNSKVLEQSTKLAVEAINNVRTVASLTMEKFFHNQYVAKLQTYKSVTIRNIHIQGIVYGLTRSSLALSNIIAFYYGAHVIKTNQANAATVVGLAQIFIICMSVLTTTVAFLPNLTKGFVACNQINSLINRVPTIKSSGNEKLQNEGDVEYKNVAFSYPTRPDVKILDDLNLNVMKGKTIALVGPSGCGKSTIIQLLERFYDSDYGQVTFGGENITRLNLGCLRLRLGIVTQEPNLFSRTIEENIGYGRVESVVSRDEVVQAAKAANIHNFISSLPLGYYTMLGEKGTQLSGGQKQRIAIARALLRNPEVLLLDEVTSALDAESEKVVQAALNRAKEDRTCIVVAHRLKTIVNSDLIGVINEGKIYEKGTHQELMNMKGLYWKLYTMQHQS